MADWAFSDDPAVQAQLDRLNAMSPGRDVLGHERLRAVLARLDHPERKLPPTFHVAGTNGKGSTCTYLRKAIEAAGMTAHVYTSPHLVRLNERIRIANRLIEDRALAAALAEVLDTVGDEQTTFFEATTAAAFLAFARTPADACIVEVGIGGRLDATNLIASAVSCGIVQLGIDHQVFLGDTLAEIAMEKAGIAKPGTPLVTLAYDSEIAARIADVAARQEASLWVQGQDWDCCERAGRLVYSDRFGELDLPLPALEGAHQIDNAGLAVAMIRSQQALPIGPAAIAEGLAGAQWPARLARLGPGPVTRLLPAGSRLWLDGAHNTAAMGALVSHLAKLLPTGGQVEIVLALLNDKDLSGIVGCLSALPCRIHAVPIAGYDCRPPDQIADAARQAGITAQSHARFAEALAAICRDYARRDPPDVLIAGSLYLAGQVLRLNQEWPQ